MIGGLRRAAVRAARAAALGARAGAAGAALWGVVEQPVGRLMCTKGFGDVRMVGKFLVGERPQHWIPVGVAVHVANGAVFGAVFAILGGRGPRSALTWTAVELVVTWPGLILIDRLHPDRRAGRWPSLLFNPRVMGQEIAMHALFGYVLGRMLPEGTARAS